MANAYTDTAAVSNLVQTAYDRYVAMALRAEPLIRNIADTKPFQQAMPGSSVVFNFYSDLAQAKTPLSEDVDPDAIALANTTNVTVTLNEYGNAALLTRKIGLLSLSDVDPAAADIIAFNLADSVDEIAQDVLRQGTNVLYAGGVAATNLVTGTGTITSAMIRKAVAKLRAGKAPSRINNLYWCGIHPEVSHDLRAETGSGAFRDSHMYTNDGASQFWPGTIGEYEGALFVESPRLYNTTDGNVATRVFRTLMVGKQALAQAVAEEPHVVVGPIVDKLNRFRPLGWYGVLGFARYREASVYRLESTSSINNV